MSKKKELKGLSELGMTLITNYERDREVAIELIDSMMALIEKQDFPDKQEVITIIKSKRNWLEHNTVVIRNMHDNWVCQYSSIQ